MKLNTYAVGWNWDSKVGSYLRCNPIQSSWLQMRLFYWTGTLRCRHVTCEHKYPLYGYFPSVRLICDGGSVCMTTAHLLSPHSDSGSFGCCIRAPSDTVTAFSTLSFRTWTPATFAYLLFTCHGLILRYTFQSMETQVYIFRLLKISRVSIPPPF
jgi:hypothetical protein